MHRLYRSLKNINALIKCDKDDVTFWVITLRHMFERCDIILKKGDFSNEAYAQKEESQPFQGCAVQRKRKLRTLLIRFGTVYDGYNRYGTSRY
jgi:hypothetical protein